MSKAFDEINRVTNARIQELAEIIVNGKHSEKDKTELVELLQPKLKYFIWQFFKDTNNTEHVLQETLWKLFKGIDKYVPAKGKFTTWSFNIAKNESLLHQYNERKVYKVDIDSVFYKIDKEDTSIKDQENQKEIHKIYTMTVNEILTLPDLDKKGQKNIEKMILIESFVNRMKGEDISKKYDLNLNTVKTKKRKAISRVRQTIIDKNPEIESRLKEVLGCVDKKVINQ